MSRIKQGFQLFLLFRFIYAWCNVLVQFEKNWNYIQPPDPFQIFHLVECESMLKRECSSKAITSMMRQPQCIHRRS